MQNRYMQDKHFFSICPSQPHRPSGRPALQAKPFYFWTPTASIQQSHVFHFHQRDQRERPSSQQSVLSSSGQMAEPPATHSLPRSITTWVLSPHQPGTHPSKILTFFFSTSSTRTNEWAIPLHPIPSLIWFFLFLDHTQQCSAFTHSYELRNLSLWAQGLIWDSRDETQIRWLEGKCPLSAILSLWTLI